MSARRAAAPHEPSGSLAAQHGVGIDVPEVLAALGAEVEKGVDDFGLEVTSLAFLQVLQHTLRRPGLAVGSVRAQCIPDVDDGEDTRRERDVVARQAVGISAPISLFVMPVRDVDGRL